MGFPFLLPAPRFGYMHDTRILPPYRHFEDAAPPYRHFERKREIFFVRDRSGKVRTADNGKHRKPSEKGSW